MSMNMHALSVCARRLIIHILCALYLALSHRNCFKWSLFSLFLYNNAQTCVTRSTHNQWDCFMALYCLLILRHCVRENYSRKIFWIKIKLFFSFEHEEEEGSRVVKFHFFKLIKNYKKILNIEFKFFNLF